MLYCCTDVAYDDNRAVAAGLLFQGWDSAAPTEIVTVKIDKVAPYKSGEFYQRELPCLLELYQSIKAKLNCIIVDGYVWLGESKPGLGHYLFEALNGEVPIVGIAKNHFVDNSKAVAIKRGKSGKELFVTTQDFDIQEASDGLAKMHGDFRIPTLLKAVDRACRDGLDNWT